MKKLLFTAILIVVVASGCAADVDPSHWFASQIIGYNLLGYDPDYNFADAVLGAPTRWYDDYWYNNMQGGVFASSLVAAPCGYAPGEDDPNDPNDGKIITTIETGGYITVKFNDPIEDDPDNWEDKDFIVFGNAWFITRGVTPNSDFESHFISQTASMNIEPMTVCVSQDGQGWYEYTSGPKADDFAPTQAYAWDYVNHTWGVQMDFTKPVPKELTKTNFGGNLGCCGNRPLQGLRRRDGIRPGGVHSPRERSWTQVDSVHQGERHGW